MTAELEYTVRRRILAGTKADLAVRFFLNGEDAEPTGTMTFAAVGVSGNVVASGSATVADGALIATLTAAQALVDVLTVTWSGLVFAAAAPIAVVTEHEVVGAWLFSLAEARKTSKEVLKSVTDYPTERIREERDRITDLFEEVLGFKLGRRMVTEVIDGDGTYRIWPNENYPGAVRTVETRTLGSTDWAESAIDASTGPSGAFEVLNGTWPRGTANVRVRFEAGMTPIPAALSRAGLLVLVEQLTTTDVMARATAQNTQNGSFTLSEEGLFGIPEVDRVIGKLALTKLPGIA